MCENLHPGTIPTSILRNLGDGACRTIYDLEECLDFNRRQVSDGAAKLIYRGLLERVERGCFQLTRAGLDAAASGVEIKSGPWRPDRVESRRPQRNTLRQRAWNAMRMCPSFTYSDLIIAAARDEANPRNNLQKFVSQLIRAGYVAQLQTRRSGTRLTSPGFKQFMLVRDTGPIAPTLRMKKQAVFDNNIREVVPCK